MHLLKNIRLSIVTSLTTLMILFAVVFTLSLAFTFPSVQAEDIEIYGIADASNPPVNVMFIFDLSGSMLETPDGENTVDEYIEGILNPHYGEDNRKDILLQALTNVLDENKTKSNLRVGFTWFNTLRAGISYPATSISADLHDLDPAVPAGSNFVYTHLPKQLEKTSIDTYYQTNIVGSLYETAKYYRGDHVSGSKDYKPPQWIGTPSHYYYETYNYQSSPHWLSYTADPGPDAWNQEGQKKWSTCTENGSSCYEGYYRYPDRLQVKDCETETVNGACTGWTCTGSGESESCTCDDYEDDYDTTICEYEYWEPEWVGANYNSPIEDNCQPSYIVLLSDGEPTYFYDEWGIENEIINAQCADMPALPDGKCGPELVEFLANNDQIAGLPESKVYTYTIGFNVAGAGKDYLETLAEKGKGVFYPASDASDIEDAFNLIIDSITGENESFTGLVTTIRASTLSSDERVFMNMFKPGDTRSWKGNTKGYFISPEGLLDVDGNEAVTIIDGAEKFKDDSRSFWSNSSDGNFVELGGASSELSAGSRDIYTYTDSASPSNSSLTKITTSETEITPALLGVADDTEKNDVITWLYDSNMADPLHAKPVLISYENQDVLYSMTNQGLIHAIDTTHPSGTGDYNGGEEIFAFVPQALLTQLKDHKTNLNSSDHLYGLDGPISYFHEDDNHDQIVNNSEKIYLYFGMRRGGNHYYALDVSNPAAPKLAWRIDGGAADFAELGQTWSRMIPTTVKWSGGVNKKVLFFGGGYDLDQDDHTTRTNDDIGNAVFMVDAVTGTLLWKGTKGSSIDSSNKMNYSIPADITVIDSDDDRVADRLYFGDMGGQVWRVDLDQANNGSSITGYRLADLADNGSEENTRRFYSPPSVAKIRGNSGFYFAVAIGSGFRAHPLNMNVDDYFFMIRDTNTEEGAPSSTWSTVTESDNDLYNLTANVIGQGSGGSAEDVTAAKAAARAVLETKKGWKLELEDTGEKNLSPSLIFDFKLAFTTFSPSNSGSTICGGGGGTGRFYLINLQDGTPIMDFADENTPASDLSKENRYKTVPGMGIPTEPVPYFPPGIGKVQIYVGKHGAADIDNPMVRINWKVIE